VIIHDSISYNVPVMMEFGQRLRTTLSQLGLNIIQSVATEAVARSLAIYMVGGFPRDLVLGAPGGDMDLVVEGDAISLAHALAAKYGGKITAHRRFGTARWSLPGSTLWPADPGDESSQTIAFPHQLDLITARRESYPRAGALPQVGPGNIEDDLRRRDFTINTLAVRLDEPHFGWVRDDFCALDDLERGRIRVLHHLSFRDDPTRMYRAVRYEQRYGFRMVDDTRKLIETARDLIPGLSAHRIRRELDLILLEEHVVPTVQRLAALNLLRPIHKSLPGDRTALRRLAASGSAPERMTSRDSRLELGWLLWLLGLSTRQVNAIASRLQFGRSLTGSVVACASLRRHLPKMVLWKPSRCTAYLTTIPAPAVQAAMRTSPNKKEARLLEQYLTSWRFVRPTLTGHDLKKLGVVPGPVYEQILSDLRAAWLDGVIENTEQERQRVHSAIDRIRRRRGRKHISTSPGGGPGH